MNEPRRSAAALEVRGLDVYYGHSHALQGVDLTLDAGVFSVVGRNGMGKTTLCKAIMGLVPVSGGSIRVRGEDITRRQPAHIGYIIIEHDMDVALRVVESVTMMHNGRIFKEGLPREIESDPEVQELYLGGGHE